MRTSTIERSTKETKIVMDVTLDGSGKSKISTGIGFLDHMLTLFAFHGNFDLHISCVGDLEVDSHHTVEDIGIALGTCINQALGDKVGITRYGNFTLPMDETLVMATLDISGRPYLVYNVQVPTQQLGTYETEMTEEFFRALAYNSGITLHLNQFYGKNTHHIIEACFKAVGRAMQQAVFLDPKNSGKVVSSKGVL